MNRNSAESGACAPHNHARAALPTSDAKSAYSPVHVLIIEDSPLVRERLISIMSALQLGIRVSTADSGATGRRMFAMCNPDVVLLEIALPDMSGFDLLAEIKSERPSCIVMMLTSCAYPEFRANSLRLRADYLLTKSLEYEGISQVLTNLARR